MFTAKSTEREHKREPVRCGLMYKKENGSEPHLNMIEARGGSPSKVNRTALVGGLFFVLVALAVVLGFGLMQTKRSGADQVSADNVAANEGAQ